MLAGTACAICAICAVRTVLTRCPVLDLHAPLDEAESDRHSGSAARRFGPPSHKAAWPKKLLDHFNLDAVRPTETEFDTWLFGGPALDYAVTQDRDTLEVCCNAVTAPPRKAHLIAHPLLPGDAEWFGCVLQHRGCSGN